MPGRHSDSSDLGSGGFIGGSSGGGLGGSFGSSFGGGWRPTGPWNPRTNLGGGGGSGFLWLVLGLLPWLFRARSGRGCGCSGFGCLIFACLIVACVAFGGVGSIGSQFGRSSSTYGGSNPNTGSSNSGNSDTSGSRQSGLAGEPPVVQTQTAKDLRELHDALDQHITQWQRDLATDEYHSISGPDAGLTQDNNTKEVVYGKCGTALYVVVVANTRPRTGPADGEGYVYTTASSPGACHPPTYTVYSSEDVGGGWYFATLQSVPGANLGR